MKRAFFVMLLFCRLLSLLWLFWRWLQVFGEVKMPLLLLNIRTIIFEQKIHEIIFVRQPKMNFFDAKPTKGFFRGFFISNEVFLSELEKKMSQRLYIKLADSNDFYTVNGFPLLGTF
jgi:hypothetical protein